LFPFILFLLPFFLFYIFHIFLLIISITIIIKYPLFTLFIIFHSALFAFYTNRIIIHHVFFQLLYQSLQYIQFYQITIKCIISSLCSLYLLLFFHILIRKCRTPFIQCPPIVTNSHVICLTKIIYIQCIHLYFQLHHFLRLNYKSLKFFLLQIHHNILQLTTLLYIHLNLYFFNS